MNTEFEVRPYRSGDEEEIVQLLELGFDSWPKVDLKCSPLDHWRWKYQDNPFKACCITVGVDNNKTIGTLHTFPLRIKIGNRIFLCGYGGDVVVHPDFRKKGVHNKMVELNRQQRKEVGVKFVYFVTENPIFLKSFPKKHHPFPHPILNLVRIQDIDKQFQIMPVKNAWLMKLGFHVVKLINDIRNNINGSELAALDLHIQRTHGFDARIDLFWKEVSDQYDFIVERRKDYLNWRYCDQRAGDFVVKQAEDSEERILGYCILRINRYLKDYPIGYLVDLLALPDRLDVVNDLVADATRYFDEQNINIVNSFIVKNHPYEKILKRYGFLDSRIKPQLFMRAPLEIVNEISKLETYNTSKVYFSYGDIDSLPANMPDYR